MVHLHEALKITGLLKKNDELIRLKDAKKGRALWVSNSDNP